MTGIDIGYAAGDDLEVCGAAGGGYPRVLRQGWGAAAGEEGMDICFFFTMRGGDGISICY